MGQLRQEGCSEGLYPNPLLKAGQAVTRLLRVFILPHLENL